MTSIFSRIFRYRQREGRTPSENYFTETFADIVSKPTLFRDVFVRWLFELVPEDVRRIKIVTHRHFNQGIPDICVEVRDAVNMSYVAIIESKIDSRERENQLNDYGRILLNNWPVAEQRILLYITKYSEEINGIEHFDNINFRQRKWSDLYKTFAEAKQNCPEGVGALENELLKLMEDWQMNGNLDPIHLRSFTICFDNEVGERLVRIQNDAWAASGLGAFLEMNPRNNKSYLGDQFSPTIQPYGVRIWMGFRYDRREHQWDVDELEIPSPVVTIEQWVDGDQQFPNMQCPWIDHIDVYPETLWTRQPTNDQMPRYGNPLGEYYHNFFQIAFNEILQVINPVN